MGHLTSKQVKQEFISHTDLAEPGVSQIPTISQEGELANTLIIHGHQPDQRSLGTGGNTVLDNMCVE